MENNSKIRPSVAAGQFYPDNKEELREEVKKLLGQAKKPQIPGEVFGLLLPHAAHFFSGRIAAQGVKSVEGKKFDTVIIMADSHYEYFDGVSIWPEGKWETPLGDIEIDGELAKKIMAGSDRFSDRSSAHLFDHTIEVQLPFLQEALGKFKLVPVAIGSQEEDWQRLAEVLWENIKDRNVLIIASSDLSHYPSYEDAAESDKKTLGAVASLDTYLLEKTIADLEKKGIDNAQTFLCSQDSVKALMRIASTLGAKAEVLGYANSGDAEKGDRSQVVGYGAVAFFKESGLDDQEKEDLIGIARASVEGIVRDDRVPSLKVDSEKLRVLGGAFVTLKEHGELRGCIGSISSAKPLFKTVSEMAVAAATQDPRFSPVTKDELGEIEYEVSVLTPLRKVDSPESIKLGSQGVMAVAGTASALFLPQVALETNWDKETFLNHLMMKAGLKPDYWKKSPVDFYVFEAQVFG